MALRAKVRGQVRNVSPAMARVFARRGIEIVDTDLPTIVPTTTSEVLVPCKGGPTDDVFGGQPVHVHMQNDRRDLVAAMDAREKPVRPVIRKRVTVVEPDAAVPTGPAILAAFAEKVFADKAPSDDLTDDELERLTAPDADG